MYPPAFPHSASMKTENSVPELCVCSKTTPRFNNRLWHLKAPIGRGTYGRVDVYKSYCGEEVAVKSSMFKHEARNEAAILRHLGNHPNIIRFYDFLAHEGNYCDLLMMELGGMSFFHYLRSQFVAPPSEAMIMRYAKQVLSGLQHLHAHCIVHLDLKSGNVIFGLNGVVKLADFGLSQNCFNPMNGHLGLTRGATGTQQICPPEAFTNEWYDGRKSDIWAFGVLLVEMKNLRYLWNKPLCSDPGYYHYMENKYYSNAPKVSLQRLIDDILVPNWTRRPTLNEVWRHPWFSGCVYYPT